MLIFLFEISPKEKRENIVVALNMDGLAPANTVKQIKNNTDRTIDRFLSILKILKIIFNAKYIIPTCNPLIARTWVLPSQSRIKIPSLTERESLGGSSQCQ